MCYDEKKETTHEYAPSPFFFLTYKKKQKQKRIRNARCVQVVIVVCLRYIHLSIILNRFR